MKKIIRDNLPEMYDIKCDEVSDSKSIMWLFDKIEEEKWEFITEMWNKDYDKMCEECADIFEVYISIIKKLNKSNQIDIMKKVVDIMNEKREEKGSFNKNYIMEI